MDKAEYNLKLEEIYRCVDQGNYAEAARIADTIDWKRVRNVRTLCMISEIYEAEDRYAESKELLLRAYRRSPVGRTILQRLVEVTIHLKQFDEAIEYYSEYCQAAPHDNSRLLLKYKIYRGRGSSVEEQIDILKEYLDQEYNEKYAYELARLYQQADRIQDCITTCDDLVLWFHSGKYVIKALELKKRYAALTPKQQEIYDHRFDEPEEEEQIGQEMQMVATSDTTLADAIVEDTERSIAKDVAAAASAGQDADKAADDAKDAPSEGDTRVLPGGTVFADPDVSRGNTGKTVEDEYPEAGDAPAEDEAETESAETGGAEEASEQEETGSDTEDEEEEAAEAAADETADETADEASRQPEKMKYDPDELQTDVARDVRELVSGIGGRPEFDEDEDAADRVIEESKKEQEEAKASQQEGIRMSQRLEMPRRRKVEAAGKLSIDDILLSMGERGEAVREAAAKASAPRKQQPAGVLSAVDEALLNMGIEPDHIREQREAEGGETAETAEDAVAKAVETAEDAVEKTAETAEGAVEKAAETAEDAVEKTAETAEDFTEKAAETAEDTVEKAAETAEGAAEKTAEAADDAVEKAAETAEGAAEKTAEAAEDAVEKAAETAEDLTGKAAETAEDLTEKAAETAENAAEKAAEDAAEKTAEAEEELEEDVLTARTKVLPAEEIRERLAREQRRRLEEELQEEEKAAEKAAEEIAGETAEEAAGEAAGGAAEETAAETDETDGGDTGDGKRPEEDAGDQDEPAGLEEMLERDAAMSDISAEAGEKKEAGQGSVMEREIVDETQESAAEPEMPKLRLKPELRDSFSGFTEVPGLESQIAYAIEQAVAKGNDRTSRTGNVLITGGHGYGKTTIAIGLAKAIAQERGSQYVKMARIYATDLSRKDIAATIAKIAGGVLIIEEAGDLSDQTADQLTTAMEFRTDGLIIIMEDEKKYLVKLLENHPRFGMKFTSQIHLPEYTADELVTFGEVYADDQNYTLSEEARAALRGKIAAQQEAGTEVSISAVVALVENAITRSNKFFRKLFAGKKRFDSMNRIILRDKDFK